MFLRLTSCDADEGIVIVIFNDDHDDLSKLH